MSILEETDPLKDIMTQFESIMENLNGFKLQITTIQTQVKGLEKNVKKQLNSFKKAASKSKNKGNRKPSGFAKPTKVTKELCEFMNKKEGTEIARTDVTRALISYIDTHNLQNVTNKQIIYPDEKLKCLLGINENEELTYFTIQKYMNKHFISLKNEKSDNSMNEIV
jgi:chromatin remodeling complex protein RSC6